MNCFFDPDHPLMQFFTTVADLIVLNLLLILCSFPIMTIGPAISAACRVSMQLPDGLPGSVSHTFFAAFRKNFRKSITVWLIALLLFGMLTAHYALILLLDAGMAKTLLLMVFCLVVYGLFALLSYLFPLIMRYDNVLWRHVRNSALLTVAWLPQTPIMVALNALPLVMILLLPSIFFYLLPFWFLIGFSAILRLNMRILKPLFKKLDEQAQSIG